MEPETIPALLDAAAAAHGDLVWLLAGDGSYSFATTKERADAVGAAAARRGIGKGDLVLLLAHNQPADVFCWLGLLQRGAIVVAVNPKSTAGELAGFLAQTRPVAIVRDRAVDHAVDRAVDSVARGSTVIDIADLLAEPATGDRHRVALDPGDPAVLIPTSGTTGRSKLVVQTHRGYVYAGVGFPYWLGLGADDRLMTSLPIFHINAPAYSLLGSMAAGASVVLLDRFSASTFIESARRYGATQFNSIGSMLELLMLQPERDDDADNPLRICYTGPSPTRERQLEIERRFGLRIMCGYALSESPYGMIWPHGERPYGTLGVPRQHPTLGHINDARVVADGREVGAGVVGELELRNPVLMKGYFEMPDETASVLVDGWLRTGDLVVQDGDGFYTFVGRKKEVIRRRGENLSPLEVENALMEHGAVADAAVVGVPSELGEEDVKAFVIPAPGATLEPEAVRGSLVGVLAPYKIPRYLEVVADLPRTPTGRTAKHLLPTGRTRDEVDFEGNPVVRTPRSREGL
ncbi:MAG: AMP-binding protein [Actinobacteria bacterium]|nr:AMP-binding protein [Actinomycetota bacterium]